MCTDCFEHNDEVMFYNLHFFYQDHDIPLVYDAFHRNFSEKKLYHVCIWLTILY